MRIMQQKLRQEERDLMWNSCETTHHTQKHTETLLLIPHTFSKNPIPTVKDEDSDIDVPEDNDSDSDVEECRPFRPRLMRNSIMAGIQTSSVFVTLISLRVKMLN